MKLAAPYQLQPKPEAQDLGFGKYFTDHMLKVNYQKQLGGWQKPEIIPMENLSIHPAAKALHYAIQVSVYKLATSTKKYLSSFMKRRRTCNYLAGEDPRVVLTR